MGGFINCFTQKKFTSKRRRGDDGTIDPEDMARHREVIARNLRTLPIQEINNYDDVDVLYGIFPSRSLNPNHHR